MYTDFISEPLRRQNGIQQFKELELGIWNPEHFIVVVLARSISELEALRALAAVFSVSKRIRKRLVVSTRVFLTKVWLLASGLCGFRAACSEKSQRNVYQHRSVSTRLDRSSTSD